MDVRARLVLLDAPPDLFDHLLRVHFLVDAVAAQHDEVLFASQSVLADLGVRADAVLDAAQLFLLCFDVTDCPSD